MKVETLVEHLLNDNPKTVDIVFVTADKVLLQWILTWQRLKQLVK